MSEVKVNKISPRTNCGTTQLGDAGDTITVTGDLKSNSLKSASGSTITLGQSGDTIQLGCGATQTGFGRTGTVDWDTTAKTASFTAVSGNGYFVNTTSGAITVTLPATPSAGDIVAVADYANTVSTNNITVARNGSNIDGNAADGTMNTNGQSFTLVYVDSTKGWKTVNNASAQISTALYVTATGGSVTTCGNYKIHTFTSPGTFSVSCAGNPVGSNTVDYLVVAGGGGGGSAAPVWTASGGGGAGGFRESSGAASGCYSRSPLGACVSALPVSVTNYPITVGGGGAGAPNSPGFSKGSNGSNSVFSTITSTAGGGGSAYATSAANPGGSGGGGGGFPHPAGNATGGSGNTPPVSPPQGNNGGNSGPSNQDSNVSGGGGGGATAAGATSGNAAGGAGGAGATTSISASLTSYAGGGGGGPNGSGGTGGGASGGPTGGPGLTAPSGTANTGGGGGGIGSTGSGSPPGNAGGSGGSGIVIIRYKYQ